MHARTKTTTAALLLIAGFAVIMPFSSLEAACGDVDASNQVDITDAVFLINYIFADGAVPLDEAAGDLDCNNQTDITDAVFLVNYIFASGPSPCQGSNCTSGVTLPGAAAAPAVNNVYSFGPIAVAEDQVDTDGLLRTRLSGILNPAATVAQVNSALAQVSGLISWMQPGDLVVTIMIPPVADSAAASAVAAQLMQSGAFLLVYPAYQAQPSATYEMRYLPESDTVGIAHLLKMRMPAAWNASGRAADLNHPITVHVPDYYASRTRHPQITAQHFVGSRGTPSVDNEIAGNHGFWVSGLVGADHNAERATGVFPVPEGNLRINSQLLGGMTSDEMTDAITYRFPSGRFVLVTSTEFLTSSGGLFGLNKFLRFVSAIKWRQEARSRMNDFIHVSCAGNSGQLTGDAMLAKFATCAAISANFSTPWEIFGPGELTFADSVLVDAYWSYTSTHYPLIETKMNNVILAGSSDRFGNELPSSSFGSDVRAVADNISGPCVLENDVFLNGCNQVGGGLIGVYSGSSGAAAQVGGLAAYLLALKPGLSNLEIKQILQTSYNASPNPGILDGYLAVQMLDQSIGNSPVRKTILDVTDANDGDPDGKFDEYDLLFYFDQFSYWEEQRVNNGAFPDYSGYDLNGDGFTGGDSYVTKFDLDIDQPPAFTTVSIEIGSTTREYDENQVADLDILCYYANTSLYTGDTEIRDSLMVNCPNCDAATRDAGTCAEPFKLIVRLLQITGKSCIRTVGNVFNCPVDSLFSDRDSTDIAPFSYTMPTAMYFDSPEGDPDSTVLRLGVSATAVYDSVLRTAAIDLTTGGTYYGVGYLNDSNMCSPMYYTSGTSFVYYTFDIGEGYECELTLHARSELDLDGHTIFTQAHCLNRLIEVTPSGNVLRYIDSLRASSTSPHRFRDSTTTHNLTAGRYVIIRNIQPLGSNLGSCAPVTGTIGGYLKADLQISHSTGKVAPRTNRLAKELPPDELFLGVDPPAILKQH